MTAILNMSGHLGRRPTADSALRLLRKLVRHLRCVSNVEWHIRDMLSALRHVRLERKIINQCLAIGTNLEQGGAVIQGEAPKGPQLWLTDRFFSVKMPRANSSRPRVLILGRLGVPSSCRASAVNT